MSMPKRIVIKIEWDGGHFQAFDPLTINNSVSVEELTLKPIYEEKDKNAPPRVIGFREEWVNLNVSHNPACSLTNFETIKIFDDPTKSPCCIEWMNEKYCWC